MCSEKLNIKPPELFVQKENGVRSWDGTVVLIKGQSLSTNLLNLFGKITWTEPDSLHRIFQTLTNAHSSLVR